MAMTADGRGRSATASSGARLFATVVGATFLLVGILGFVPGATTHLSDIAFSGHDSPAKLLGIFQVSILHNLVHLLFGIAGLAAARADSSARAFLIGGGVVYLLLWGYGLAIDLTSDSNFVPFNTADNWLHFALGAGMVGLGVIAVAAERKAQTSTSSAGTAH